MVPPLRRAFHVVPVWITNTRSSDAHYLTKQWDRDGIDWFHVQIGPYRQALYWIYYRAWKWI